MNKPLDFIARCLARLQNNEPISEYELLELEERVLYDASPLGVVAEELDPSVQASETPMEDLQAAIETSEPVSPFQIEQQIADELSELDAIINGAELTTQATSATLPIVIFSVNTNEDIVDDSDDFLSLREAIQAANSEAALDPANEPIFQILLDAADQTFFLTDAEGDIDIQSQIELVGRGIEVTTIDASLLQQTDRVFEVFGGDSATFRDLTITGGDAESGGGILVRSDASVRLETVAVTGNTASVGGGLDVFGTATIIDSSISSNIGDNGAGGIRVTNDGNVSLDTVTVTGNTATNGDGGGVEAIGFLNATNSTFSGNTASNSVLGGGGLVLRNDSVLENVTISANSTDGQGGGILVTNGGSHELTNVTVFNNTANGLEGGGGIGIRDGSVTITNATIANNTATAGSGGGIRNTGGDVNLSNSIVARNVAQGSISELNGPVGDNNNIVGDSPELLLDDVLRDNGGAVETLSIASDSSAIDAATSTLATDARGFAIDLGTRDIGAFELTLQDTSSIDFGTLLITTSQDINTSQDAFNPSDIKFEGLTDQDVIQFSNLTLEDGDGVGATTDATHSEAIDFDLLAAMNADIDALHVVGPIELDGEDEFRIQGFALQQGDVLFSGGSNADFGLEGEEVNLNPITVHVFRPDVLGDYTSGQFFENVIDTRASVGLGLGSITAFSLVESETTVGDVSLSRGDFLYTTSSNDIYLFDASANDGAGAASVLIAGGDIGLNRDVLGIELIESATQIGGVNFESGDILVSVDAVTFAPSFGSEEISNNDVIRLNVTSTSIDGGPTAATASIVFDGSDVGLGGAEINGLAIKSTPTSTETDPSLPDSTLIDQPPTDLSTGLEINTDGGNDAFFISDGGLSEDLTATTVEVRFAADPGHSSRTTSAMKMCLRYKSIPNSIVWNWTSVPESWYSRRTSTISKNLSTAKFIRSALLGTASVASGLFTSTEGSLKVAPTPTPPLTQPKLYQELILKRVSLTTYAPPMKSYKTINTSLT